MSNALPDKHVVLRYPPGAGAAEPLDVEETYQLLELPPEILKQVEALDGAEPFPLTIKGRPSDDATICTPNATFQLRTIGISNSLLVCRSAAEDTDVFLRRHVGEEAKETLHISDTCHQVFECLPIAPNLERIRAVLRPSAWEGMDSSLGKRKRDEKNGKVVKRWTKEQLKSVVQASDRELEDGLRERNVVEVDGKLMLLPAANLKDLLVLLISLLHINSKGSDTTAPTKTLIETLEKEYDILPSLSSPVLGLFGHVEGEMWRGDMRKIVKEVGMGILTRIGRNKKQDEFVDEWKKEVGDSWEDLVDMKLLEGEYLANPPPASALAVGTRCPLLTYFPISSLPLQPAPRFSELFLTRTRWRPDEMTPFLKGLTRDGDKKERDKLVVKFVRVVKERDGVWWYPRRA
ncbi:hypothetical protein L202_07476 [Cryptococcus amylolentus CBS 6039]|uniref:Sister chromatid cohesion protein DCC1 n=2 Tax=Cryptococcus amylolentus TaxID=104669 RepID=A0A1E3HCB7_9TREE|nr:hypothetical protein L202_07476 [Cryptococcus amylolentus CBS 6039]ODN73982.1 hypothetical protein L202_07476 [Cryptococcus amylolentus CBS 6039]ODO00195.1 hypothetical protein I350_06820 [Cryptococcus amylolentus CBS 6273]